MVGPVKIRSEDWILAVGAIVVGVLLIGATAYAVFSAR